MSCKGSEIDEIDMARPNNGLVTKNNVKCADKSCWQKDQCKRFMPRRMRPDLTIPHADSLRRKWQAPEDNCINFQEK